MTNQSIGEKKPFRFVKFFTFSSLIVMFAATIVMSAMNAHWVKSILQQKSEEYAHLLVENLNHQVFLQFIIPTVLKYGKIKLREQQQYERMERVVRTTLHSFNVEMVNIYDMKNTISYSFDKDKIGSKDENSKGYAQAIQNVSTSRLIQKGNPFEILMGFPHTTKIATFAPLRAEKPLSSISGPVLGVVEIVQDISEDYLKIFQLQLLTIITCFLVMGILFAILIFVVRQGERIIEARAEERLKLEEKLQQAEHLSAIGEMTAGVSHEIRNPLGIIKSSAELLKKKMGRLNQPTNIVDIIVEESVRLNNIITDFLDFAKPMNLVLKPCSIEAIIDKNTHYISQQLNDNNIIIKKIITDEIPEIMLDPEKIYQAFLNIMLNSCQAMQNGGTITVSVYLKKTDQHTFVTIIFEDNGSGIPEETIKKIWNPFFTTKEKGTGLGLGIVKNIIESHHGEIQISSSKNAGAKVEITLPSREMQQT
ncbi:Two-component hybrid sensor and response regulator histidine kinase (Ntr family) [Desulfamplus magnetovallimortis]|uniref:histidine kinase n=1 Tax=Desulfamplus magnetovallimortis TaxID=1246637 RepID=A0A1W1HIJ5_9BACT|nr:ATP-binding protein [Desulfamplus magnetovallimortis]SLM32198.1 Two-component hybrid sensor and response regulator histidine kinase (Ntr family) [Desulfamplus magnetovallimortis]